MTPTDILIRNCTEALNKRRAFIDSEDGLKKVTLELFKRPGQKDPDVRFVPECVDNNDR